MLIDSWVTWIVVALGTMIAWSSTRGMTSPGRLRWIQALGWGPGIGFGLVSLATFWGLFFGFDTWRIGWIAIAFALTGTLAFLMPREPALAVPPPAEAPLAHPKVLIGLRLLLVLSCGGLAWAYCEWIAHRPHGTTDAVFIWGARSLFLHRAGDGIATAFEVMKLGHPDYPLMLPGAIAGQFALSGTESLGIPQATALLFLIGLGFLLYGTLRSQGSAMVATAAVLLLVSTPTVWRWAFSQVADLPMAYLVLAVVSGMASQWGQRPVPPLLVGFFLGLLSWMKNEGMVLAAVFLGCFCVATLWFRRPLRELGRVVSIVAGSLPGALATFTFKTHWVGHSEAKRFLRDPLEKALDLERWLVSIQGLAAQLDPFHPGSTWAGTWIVLVILLVWALTRRPTSSPLAAFGCVALLAALGTYVFAYVMSPYELTWHTSKSADRILLQVYPTMIAAIFSALATPRSTGARTGEFHEPT